MRQFDFYKELSKLTPRLRDNHTPKIYIFGTGAYWIHMHKWYRDVFNIELTNYIHAFVDNNASERKAKFMNLPVISPLEIDIDNGVVLISSTKHFQEISQQLQELGLICSNGFFLPVIFELILKRFVYAETARFSQTAKSKRCFIIGNGPSLRVDDLETLYKNKEVTFGVNRITKIFPETNWRPTYYFFHDLFAMPDAESLEQMKCPKFTALHNAGAISYDEHTYYYETNY